MPGVPGQEGRRHHSPPRTGHTGKVLVLLVLFTLPLLRFTIHALFGLLALLEEDQPPPGADNDQRGKSRSLFPLPRSAAGPSDSDPQTGYAHLYAHATASNAGWRNGCTNWSDGVAVGSEDFVKEIKSKLGYSAVYRNITGDEDIYALSEAAPRYSAHFGAQNVPLSTISRLVDG